MNEFHKLFKLLPEIVDLIKQQKYHDAQTKIIEQKDKLNQIEVDTIRMKLDELNKNIFFLNKNIEMLDTEVENLKCRYPDVSLVGIVSYISDLNGIKLKMQANKRRMVHGRE